LIDIDTIKGLLKEYGPAGLILIALIIFKSVGLLEFESFKNSVSVGTFIAGIACILLVIIYSSKNLEKKIGGDPGVQDKIFNNTIDIKEGMDKTVSLLNDQGNQSNQIQYLVSNVYELVKGIPNKHLIFEILMIQTKYLMNNSLEYILDYVISKDTPLDNDGIVRIQKSLERNLARLKVVYMENIIKISRNFISNEGSAEIESFVEKSISNMYNILTVGNMKVEDILFKINVELKDLEDDLKAKFKSFIKIEISDPDYTL